MVPENGSKSNSSTVAANAKSLDDLICQLHEIFASDTVNVELVQTLLDSYESCPVEWETFANFDPCRHTRNLVDEGNGKYNLMLVCWGGGHASTIHDHSDSHCFMKMLQGELMEVRYAWPDAGDCEDGAGKDNGNVKGLSTLREIGRNRLGAKGVCYINDSMGIHSIENASTTDTAVSLHLYCPPFSSCYMFDKRSGLRTKCQITFSSKYGEKTNSSAPTPLACSGTQ